jgi:hypothetical protein
MNDPKLVDLALWLHHETGTAFLVSDDGVRDRAIWLPKSLVERAEHLKGQNFMFVVPEWLAHEKGLI